MANINVVETREGLKLVKDLQVGDYVLTPRGYSPIIYIEDHPVCYELLILIILLCHLTNNINRIPLTLACITEVPG